MRHPKNESDNSKATVGLERYGHLTPEITSFLKAFDHMVSYFEDSPGNFPDTIIRLFFMLEECQSYTEANDSIRQDIAFIMLSMRFISIMLSNTRITTNK